jgi:hypothetical protein
MSRVWKFFASLAVFAALCALGLSWFVNHEVERAFNQVVADVPGLSLSYDDISVDIFDHSVELTMVDATLPRGQRATADLVRITAFDQKNPLPHFITAQALGLAVENSPATLGSWADPLASMGIDVIKGDAALDYAYDPKTSLLTVKTLSLDSPELGHVEISGVVDRLDLAQLRVEKLLGMRLHSADLVFIDRSLVELLVGGMARLLNTTGADARDRIRAEIAAMVRYAHGDRNRVAADALAGLEDFVAAPGMVAISLRPAEPVPLLYFFMGRDIYDNMRLFNVEVTTDAERHI